MDDVQQSRDCVIWSPDGSRILFGSDRDGGVFHLYQKRADGVGSDEIASDA